MRIPSTLHLGVVAIVLVVGCGEGPPPAASTAESSISALARLYGEYASRHQDVGPPDEAAFRGFIASLPEEQRRALGLSDLDQALISPRDGQPFEIRYGLSPRQMLDGRGLRNQAIVIHERQGVAGRRWIATGTGITVEVSEEEFARAMR